VSPEDVPLPPEECVVVVAVGVALPEEELEELDDEEEQDPPASIGKICLSNLSHQLDEPAEQATGVGVALPVEVLEELDDEEEPPGQGVGVGLVFQSAL
jgi:hypothetical protein